MSHRAVVEPGPAGKPKTCSRCGQAVELKPSAPRWTHKETHP